MRCQISFGILCLAVTAGAAAARRNTNPEDLQFRVSFTNNIDTYHVGERIPMQISYASQSENKYYGSFEGPQPEFATVTIKITPTDGIIDPRRLLEAIGWGGSILSAEGYLTSQPHALTLDLSVWYRFQKPGRYSIVVSSKQVSRIRTAQEGGGKERLELESQPLELHILAQDSVWAASQLDEVEDTLRAHDASGQRSQALYRLALLDNPTSVARLTQLYLDTSDSTYDGMIPTYLRESVHADEIISVLQSALQNPAIRIPDTLIEVLTHLETRRDLGILPVYPVDPDQQKEWNDKFQARAKVRQNYEATAQRILERTLPKKSGPERATAIFQNWNEAERLNVASPIGEEKLGHYRTDVLAVRDELSRAQQAQFLFSGWNTMPHDQLLPLIVELTQDSGQQAERFNRSRAFQFWCEDWATDCQAAILSDVRNSKMDTPKEIILLLNGAERPEFDSMLKEALAAPDMTFDSAHAQQVAAVALRAGSKGIIPEVASVLDLLQQQQRCAGNVQGELLGYLFRLSPQDAAKRLDASLQRPTDYCGGGVLRVLHFDGYSDETIPVVTHALDSPNLCAAAAAALYLAEHAQPDAREFLWRRLEALWKDWAGRSIELQGPFTARDDSAAAAKGLQEALVSSLVHARNWKPSAAELDRLRAGCLTDPCRQIVDGKMFLNL